MSLQRGRKPKPESYFYFNMILTFDFCYPEEGRDAKAEEENVRRGDRKDLENRNNQGLQSLNLVNFRDFT